LRVRHVHHRIPFALNHYSDRPEVSKRKANTSPNPASFELHPNILMLSITQAQAKLAALIHSAEAGETTPITRHGTPVTVHGNRLRHIFVFVF
jgi:hypothetical protein